MQPIIIIEGYKGCMPLDLTHVEPKYHKIMIDQHNEDIREYKKYQDNLPSRLRYENTNERITKALNLEQQIQTQINNAKRLDQIEKDNQYLEERNLYLEKKCGVVDNKG